MARGGALMGYVITRSSLFGPSSLSSRAHAADQQLQHQQRDTGRVTNTTIQTMSVLLETSLGDIVIDLLTESSPRACEK